MSLPWVYRWESLYFYPSCENEIFPEKRAAPAWCGLLTVINPGVYRAGFERVFHPHKGLSVWKVSQRQWKKKVIHNQSPEGRPCPLVLYLSSLTTSIKQSLQKNPVEVVFRGARSQSPASLRADCSRVVIYKKGDWKTTCWFDVIRGERQRWTKQGQFWFKELF